jgi:3',5'-cyclic AMP phosphodiesterase CpdA
MRRLLSLLAVTCLLAAAFAPSAALTAELEGCGLTTLDAQIRFTDANNDGRPDPGSPLFCGPGRGLVVRVDLAAAQPGRDGTRQALASWIGFADLQLADEESPLRGEWADKCGKGSDYSGSPVSASAWRPHETMNPHLINAHVKAANAIAERGGPVLGAPVDFAVTMGDLADNQQYNETRLFIDLFDGGKVVDPGSGLPATGAEAGTFLDGRRYDGVQAQDPKGSGAPLPAASEGGPPTVESPNPQDALRLLDIAQQPFYAEGLRSGGRQMPWLAVPGNHDVKVQGTIPDNNKAWRDLVRRYAIGNVKLMELGVDYQARICKAIVDQDDEMFASVFKDIIANPYDAGTTKVVPPDWRRLPLYRTDEAKETGDEESCKAIATSDPLHVAEIQELCESSWLEQLGGEDAPGFPARHGLAAENRCKDDSGQPLARLCYAFERGPFLFVGVDTNPPEGLERGNIDLEQWDWLDRTLKANSSSYYDEAGALVQNPNGRDKLVVIMSHHTTTTMDNKGAVSDGIKYTGQQPPFDVPTEGGAKYGEDLIELLQHYPNVILHASGHTHENKVWAHNKPGLGAGYWEVNTAAIADVPHQSRVFEVADNGDGTLSIFAVTFEGAVPADARAFSWTDDSTTRDGVNEDWLAAFGREVGFFDPQQDPNAVGKAQDQNVELLLPAPFDLSPDQVTTRLTYTGQSSGQIGRDATVAAVLSTSSGEALEGMTVTFRRGDRVVSALTDATGTATASLRVDGPKGGSVPLSVSFAGAGTYPPVSIEVPFTAVAGKS